MVIKFHGRLPFVLRSPPDLRESQTPLNSIEIFSTNTKGQFSLYAMQNPTLQFQSLLPVELSYVWPKLHRSVTSSRRFEKSFQRKPQSNLHENQSKRVYIVLDLVPTRSGTLIIRMAINCCF